MMVESEDTVEYRGGGCKQANEPRLLSVSTNAIAMPLSKESSTDKTITLQLVHSREPQFKRSRWGSQAAIITLVAVCGSQNKIAVCEGKAPRNSHSSETHRVKSQTKECDRVIHEGKLIRSDFY